MAASNEGNLEIPMDDDYVPDELLLVLQKLGYTPLPDENAWLSAIQADSREDSSIPAIIVSVCTFLVNELCDLTGLQNSKLTVRNGEAEAASFGLELRSFLADYGSPYPQSGFDIVEQPSRKRILIEYLTAELEACRMCRMKEPRFTLTVTSDQSFASAQSLGGLRAKPVQVRSESECAQALKSAAIALGLPKPPPTITISQLFDKFEARIGEIFNRLSETARSALIGRPLLTVRLSDRQNTAALRLVDSMSKEYSTRRAVLLKRFDLTVNAFSWSEVIVTMKKNTKKDPIADIIAAHRPKMISSVSIGLAEVLAAREDVLRVDKTSSGRARVRTELNRVRMGAVRDRGGRAWEVDPPERETFAKQQRVRVSTQEAFVPKHPMRGSYHHPQQLQSASSRGTSGGVGYTNPYSNHYAHSGAPSPMPYHGQAYDGPGFDQPRGRGGHRPLNKGPPSRIQRGRPY